MFRRQLANRAWRDALRGGRNAPVTIAVRRATRRRRRRDGGDEIARERSRIDQPYASRLTTNARECSTTQTACRAYGAGFLNKDEVTARVVSVVKNFAKVDASKVTATSAFAGDLGLDSLDTVEVVMAMEEEFAVEIPDAEADKIQSIPEAVSYLAANPNAK